MEERTQTEFPRRALLLMNPVAGRRAIQRDLTQVIRIFMDAGYLVTTMVTAARGEMTAYAARFGAAYDLVVCAGGDGTLNETVNGLAAAGVDVPVGYLPCGTTNDFANAHGLAKDILPAARRIAAGNRTRYDIGRFGDRCFCSAAFFGAFSWMAYTTDQTLKNKWGYGAYVLDGVRDLSRIKPIHMRIWTDGVLHEGDYLLGTVTNATSVGGYLELPRELVDLSDGLLEVVLVKAPKSLLEFDMIARAVAARDFSGPYLTLTQAREIRVENPPELQWSLDGEMSGVFDTVDIRAMQGFLNLQG